MLVRHACSTAPFLAAAVKGVSTGRSTLPIFFEWSYIGPYCINLTWNVTELGEQYADIIELIAMGITYFHYGMNFTPFSNGNITLCGLRPNSTYNVTVIGLSRSEPILKSTEIVTTAANCKLERAAIMCYRIFNLVEHIYCIASS